MFKNKKLLKKALITLIVVFLLLFICALSISAYVVKRGGKALVDLESATELDADCILVLGAMVKDERPSLMLRDRLDCAIDLHFSTGLPLLMSGDRAGEEYDEVGVMRDYAIGRGVLSENIILDPEGYSTLESVVGLKELSYSRAIVVTQEYHIYRALYLCESAGIDAVGVPCEYVRYYGEEMRLAREVVARCKDFLFSFFI